MERDLLAVLACPVCHSSLRLTVEDEDDDGIYAGSLFCVRCSHDYAIVRGVPNLLPPGQELKDLRDIGMPITGRGVDVGERVPIEPHNSRTPPAHASGPGFVSFKPLVFISHSSHDKFSATELAAELRSRGLSVWIDHERIKFGASIPAAIELGLSQSACIVVLVSRAFVSSRWCRAEYEPLLAREIEQDRILILPVLIDQCELPILLSKKRYVDLRTSARTSRRRQLDELADQVLASTRDPFSEQSTKLVETHLSSARQVGALRDFLTNYDWLLAKLRLLSITAVIADFPEDSTDSGLRQIREALTLSAHVLTKAPEALGAQLAGRLMGCDDVHVRALVGRARETLKKAGELTPVTPCLTEPGGSLLRTFDGHSIDVSAISGLPDGRRAVSVDVYGTLNFWDLSSGQVVLTFEGPTRVGHAVSLLCDGRRALLGNQSGTLTLTDLTNGRVIETFEGHTSAVQAVTVLHDGLRALSGSFDGTLKLRDLDTACVMRSLPGHYGVNHLAVLPDGSRALLANGHGEIKLVRLDTGQVLETYEDRDVTAMTVLPDGTRVLSGNDNGTLDLWDLFTGKVLRSFEGHGRQVTAVAVLQDGSRALSGSADGTMKFWDLTLMTDKRHQTVGKRRVISVALLPDERRTLSVRRSTLSLCDLATGQIVKSFAEPPVWAPSVKALAVLRDGLSALSACEDGTLRLWDLADGRERRSFEGHSGAVNAVILLPDGARVLSGSDDRTLKLWELTTGRTLQTFSGHTGRVNTVSLLPDGNRALSACDDGTWMLWDLQTGRVLQSFVEPKRLKWGLRMPITAVAALLDARRALSGEYDGTLKLWDLRTGRVLQTLDGHTHAVNAVTVLPDGNRALSASEDRTLKLWDLATGQVHSTFYDDAAVMCLAVVARTGHVVVGNKLGRLYVLATS